MTDSCYFMHVNTVPDVNAEESSMKEYHMNAIFKLECTC